MTDPTDDLLAENDIEAFTEQVQPTAREADSDAFWDWLSYGIEKGWVSEPVCGTHDVIPQTVEGTRAWNDGQDPCEHVVRLWPDGQTPKVRTT